MSNVLSKGTLGWAVAVLALASLPAAAAGQLTSSAATAGLAAALAEELNVTVTSGSTVNFTLNAGSTADGDVPVGIQTQWVLNPSRGAVSLYAYFDVPSTALTDGAGNDIPSSAILGQVATGIPTSFTAFTQTNSVGPAGASLKLFEETITGVNKNKTRNDNLGLRIDLSSLEQLPAGSYNGTLKIQARAL